MNSATKKAHSLTRAKELVARVQALDWERVAQDLNDRGFANIEALVTPEECNALTEVYSADKVFRNRVVMAQHGFGRGEYKYFNYPLPDLVSGLRTSIYPNLVATANDWYTEMGIDARFPLTHAAFIERCHNAGQLRPTPLMLKYQTDDYNCLHQDLYGEHVFPFQLTVLLSEPDKDFDGGEFVLTEQRPRMQSRVEVVPLKKGDAVIFAVNHRPVHGKRGVYRVNLRHGVSRIRSGHRHALGIIFHDAR